MNINLSQTSAAARMQKRKDKMFTRGIIFAIVILLLVVGVFIWIRIYNGTVEGKIAAVDNKIEMLDAKSSRTQMTEVADVLFRAQSMERNQVQNSVVLNVLEMISGALVDTVTVDTYDYTVTDDHIEVRVKLSTTDLLSVAKQVDAFKKAKVFHAVTVEDVNRNAETGAVEFMTVLEYHLSDKQVSEKQNS